MKYIKSQTGFGIRLLLLLAVSIILSWNVFAEPIGPSNIDNLGSSRYSIEAAKNVSAIAGNVTELNFTANSVTSTWQGYYGNISGSIVLGNSDNQTMYNWAAASPNGEIYATRTASVPAWTSIACADATDIATEDTALGVDQLIDQDSVNRTFLNTTTFTDFYVGGVNINSTQTCYSVNLHNNTGAPSTNFAEVLLHDGSSMIYTAIVKQDSVGFDGRTHDFEMLVGEDGHNDESNPTLYYFYVELG